MGVMRRNTGMLGQVLLQTFAEAFARGRIDAVTVTSSEGLDNLWDVADATTRAAWRDCPTFVPHPRIAARARALGLQVVDTAGGDAGLIAGLLEWFASHPLLRQ